jgi:hypothetical protein
MRKSITTETADPLLDALAAGRASVGRSWERSRAVEAVNAAAVQIKFLRENLGSCVFIWR